jgi:hypothetical protein
MCASCRQAAYGREAADQYAKNMSKLPDSVNKILSEKSRITQFAGKALDKSDRVRTSHPDTDADVSKRMGLGVFWNNLMTWRNNRAMDAKTLEKMTVVKLREEAMKFDDMVGAHGMDKHELVQVLKVKFGIHEEKTASELLIERKHALKKKIAQLKAEKAALVGTNDKKHAALLRRRLRRQRRILKKVAGKAVSKAAA